MSDSPRRLNSTNSIETVSPRPNRHALLPRLGSFGEADSPHRPNVVVGFSPPPSAGLATVAEHPKGDIFSAGSPRSRGLHIQTGQQASRLSPHITTPIEQTSFNFSGINLSASPRQLPASPRHLANGEFPPRSRRNSAAIVSVSLTSRSRSRTPRSGAAALPQTSGHVTPNKGSNTATPKPDGTPAKNPNAQTLAGEGAGDVFDDWRPTGGMLLDDGVGAGDHDEALIDDQLEDDGRQWQFDGEEDDRAVENILAPGMLFGEGQEFQGELVQPAVRQIGGEAGAEGLPLRRGGSEMGKPQRGDVTDAQGTKKVYQVVRQLGSGSYAVVYLVREKGGRRREYGKCHSAILMRETG